MKTIYTLIWMSLMALAVDVSAQSDDSGKSWSAGLGFGEMVQLPLTNHYVEHWRRLDGSKYFTDYSLRQGRHFQAHYAQQQSINQWLAFKWSVQAQNWQFHSEEHLRYQATLDNSSNPVPPLQMSTYRTLQLSSLSALSGLVVLIPLNKRFTWTNTGYAGFMAQLGNLYPDAEKFYRSRQYELGLQFTGVFESCLEYSFSSKLERTRVFASYQWAFMGGRRGEGFWQNVPGFRQMQVGIRVKSLRK